MKFGWATRPRTRTTVRCNAHVTVGFRTSFSSARVIQKRGSCGYLKRARFRRKSRLCVGKQRTCNYRPGLRRGRPPNPRPALSQFSQSPAYCAALASSIPFSPRSACSASLRDREQRRQDVEPMPRGELAGRNHDAGWQPSQCSQARLPKPTSIARWACFQASSLGM